MWSTEQDTGNLRFDSSIPPIGSEANPQKVTNEQCVALGELEFITQTPADRFGEYTMVFRNKNRYYKVVNKITPIGLK